VKQPNDYGSAKMSFRDFPTGLDGLHDLLRVVQHVHSVSI
jgi:hypothetical protein